MHFGGLARELGPCDTQSGALGYIVIRRLDVYMFCATHNTSSFGYLEQFMQNIELFVKQFKKSVGEGFACQSVCEKLRFITQSLHESLAYPSGIVYTHSFAQPLLA